jgi:hypothetical protein
MSHHLRETSLALAEKVFIGRIRKRERGGYYEREAEVSTGARPRCMQVGAVNAALAKATASAGGRWAAREENEGMAVLCQTAQLTNVDKARW